MHDFVIFCKKGLADHAGGSHGRTVKTEIKTHLFDADLNGKDR